MARKNTIRLLLINGSDNDTELVVSLFRSAGRVARAQRIDSADELATALEQSWDLLIADDNHPELKVEACLDNLRQAGTDFPVLVQRDGADLSALFAAGAADVIPPSDDQRLIGAALREIENLEQRRSVAKLRRQLQEAEQRNALLLGETDQALAYVADGMVINANTLFAERFGYSDPAEIDCAPVVDLLAASDLDGFKSALKNNVEGEFACTGQCADGATFHASVRLRNATYDDDPCTQLIVSNPPLAAAGAEGGSDHDIDTGLFSRAYLLEQMERRDNGWLIVLQIQRFAELRSEVGLSDSIALAAAVAAFIADKNPFGPCCLARIADDAFAALIEGGDSARLQELAQELCAAIGKQRFAQPVNMQAGIVSSAGDDALALIDQAFAASEKADAGQPVYLHRETIAARSGTQTQAGDNALLEDALHEQRFVLLFQPIISLRGAGGEHYEAQLRMQGSNNALELPDNFIEALGVSADNAKLDRWILLEATKRLATNRGRGNDTRLIINLTASALQDDALTSWLGVALKAAGLPSSSLILQLRETDVLNDQKAAKVFIEAVRQIGCQTAISGFGRMQDAEKTLRNLHTDIVQIDGSFTRSLLTSGDMQPIKTLVTAASGKDVKTIVPFVENASVLATLWQVGADFIQGHYLQAPSREMNYEFTDIA